MGSTSQTPLIKGSNSQKLDRSGLVTEMVGGDPYHYYPLGKHVVRAIGVCGGRPTFKYTRIEITGALDRLMAGESIDSILTGYRKRVSREALNEAVQIIKTQFIQSLPDLTHAQ